MTSFSSSWRLPWPSWWRGGGPGRTQTPSSTRSSSAETSKHPQQLLYSSESWDQCRSWSGKKRWTTLPRRRGTCEQTKIRSRKFSLNSNLCIFFLQDSASCSYQDCSPWPDSISTSWCGKVSGASMIISSELLGRCGFKSCYDFFLS